MIASFYLGRIWSDYRQDKILAPLWTTRDPLYVTGSRDSDVNASSFNLKCPSPLRTAADICVLADDEAAVERPAEFELTPFQHKLIERGVDGYGHLGTRSALRKTVIDNFTICDDADIVVDVHTHPRGRTGIPGYL